MTGLGASSVAGAGLRLQQGRAAPEPRAGTWQGWNPLVAAAHPLLEIAILLRHAPAPPSLEALRAQLTGMMRAFVEQARGVDAETLAAARYCLSTFLDEVIAATSWGGGGAWSSRSLLVIFHGEASGGERFFTILHRLSQDPAANLDALELLYIILALGMEGRYRLMEAGAGELEQLRARLLQLMTDTRGAVEQPLSTELAAVSDVQRPGLTRPGLTRPGLTRPGRPARDRRRPAWRIRPLWLASMAALCLAAAALAIANTWMRTPARAIRKALGDVRVIVRAPAVSGAAFASASGTREAAGGREAVDTAPLGKTPPRAESIGAGSVGAGPVSAASVGARSIGAAPPDASTSDASPVSPVVVAAAPAAIVSSSAFEPAVRQLATLLAGDIATGAIRMTTQGDRAVLTLDGDGLFASGSSWVRPARITLLRRLGQALREVPGTVMVVGHTDNIRPAPGAPSNQELSLRRAARVRDLLVQEAGDADRFFVQGRADSEPVASNDTESGRARNRRVTIALVAPGAAP
ncbi:type IVB secretion system protein IcmH/DotU [Bordetella bronchialis]|uniref:type IVB secretion system protein IcmH/DotU n=1 Tax=Bordetella bronchialis TaxID=463025 RepID=UPI000A62ED59|nr:type IVB secretion system protein IcmH/DotU [Bordetella bronchialis]